MRTPRLYLILSSMLVVGSLCLAQTGTTAASQKATVPAQAEGQSSPPVQAGKASEVARPAVSKTEYVGRAGSSADFATSIASFHAEREQARQSGSQSQEAEAALHEARTIELWTSVDRGQSARVPEAISAYQAVIASGNAEQRSLAANNMGVLLLRQGDSKNALQAFQKVNLNSIAAPDKYLYQYNYGRTLELNKDMEGAYARYSEAVSLRPDFLPAVDGAFRVLWVLLPPKIDEAARLANILVRGGRADYARDRLKNSLSRWKAESGVFPLLGELVHSYVASQVTPPQFHEKESALLAELKSASPQLRPAVAELERSYSGNFQPSFGHYAEPFPAWSNGAYRVSFGELLKMVGDYYSGEKDYSAALACYSNAWIMARLPEGALYTAALLRDHQHELDPSGQLRARLTESIFFVKGNAYSQQDWPNIQRLHTVLGTMFESESRWGPAGDPRSALFQWQHALAAENEVRAKNPGLPPSPGLHLHLATCYRIVNQLPEARREYLAAAEAFLHASDRKQARSTLRILESLGVEQMSPEEHRRFEAAAAGSAG